VTFTVPAKTPQKTPVLALIVPIAVLDELHVPVVDVVDNVVHCPTHTAPAPVMAPGKSFTVTTFIEKHPDDAV
jgi:hypothetical protein